MICLLWFACFELVLNLRISQKLTLDTIFKIQFYRLCYRIGIFSLGLLENNLGQLPEKVLELQESFLTINLDYALSRKAQINKISTTRA